MIGDIVSSVLAIIAFFLFIRFIFSIEKELTDIETEKEIKRNKLTDKFLDELERDMK